MSLTEIRENCKNYNRKNLLRLRLRKYDAIFQECREMFDESTRILQIWDIEFLFFPIKTDCRFEKEAR